MLALRRAAAVASQRRALSAAQSAPFSSDTFREKERAAETSYFKCVLREQQWGSYY